MFSANDLVEALKPYAKAFAGAIAGGLTAYITAMADKHVTAVEWATIALAALATLGVTYSVPNKQRTK